MDPITTTHPVVFIIFNRPDNAAKVFDCIRAARPPRLFVIADGARPHKSGETERCREARAIIDRVDWPCDIQLNYSDINLGCKRRISSGLDWVFSQVEEAIILEDDCVPQPTFFQFCDELLEKYRDDHRVMSISGDNYQFCERRTGDSYYFSVFFHCWGWATWRRAWRLYDIDMKTWPEARDNNRLADIWANREAAEWWTRMFERVYADQVDTWAYRMQFASFMQSGLGIIPSVNLVTNIGFDAGATHTRGGHILENLPSEPMSFPLRHPAIVVPNRAADTFTQVNIFQGKPPKIKVALGPLYPAVRWLLKPLLKRYLLAQQQGS